MDRKSISVSGLILIFLFLAVPIAQAQQKGLDASNPIKIGYLNAFGATSAAVLTTQHLPGLNEAAEEINAAGGVLGRPFKVVTRDDKMSPEHALREAKDLVVNEKVFWIQGVTSSGVARVLSEYVKIQKRIFVTDIAKSEKLTADWGHPYFFRSTGNAAAEAKALAIASKQIFGPLKKIYNLSPDYEGGHAAWRMFFESYQKLVPDVKVVGDVWGKLGTQEFTSYLTAILNSDADLIYTCFYGGDSLTMLKQSIALGLNGKIPMVGHWHGTVEVTPSFNADFYPKKTIGCGQYPFWGLDIPENKKFVERIKSKYGVYPGYAVNGYSFVHAMAKAIKKVGSLDTEKVIAALEGTAMETPIGPVELRACDHQAMWPTFVGLIGELPGWEFYGTKDHVKVGVEAFPTCEEIAKSRKK